ncbi:MAG: trehalose-6-phosphate synthase, partial [Terriglobales bacterium]
LKAYRAFLRSHTEFHRRVELFQLVVPSRESIPRYQELKNEVEQLVTQINGEFGWPGWIPINYIHRSIPREELIAIYRASDLALVTPLKDGMNLVAKEFCAAQIDERGVLIVSEFAGAGPELRSGAIIVNPNDFAEVAQALYDAAHMSADDKRCRMRLLRQIVKDHNVHRWIRSFLQAIPEAVPAKGDPGGDSWEPVAKSTEPSRKVMPGVALVAAALSPASRPRYAMGKDAKLRVLGSAAGED